MKNSSGAPGALTVVGPGRAGSSIARAASAAGVEVTLIGREIGLEEVSTRCVLLCVPDAEIEATARAVAATGAAPATIGHVSGATTLDRLAAAGATEGRFSVHPLQTIPDRETDLAGAHAAVAGNTDTALSVATGLAVTLGMHPFRVEETDRATYHAAASIGSNFLVTLEQTAADLLDGIGVEQPREVLAPLLRRSLENWIEAGPEALTGPIARGDEVTVARHREAIAERAPESLGTYDALADRTAALARPVEVPR